MSHPSVFRGRRKSPTQNSCGFACFGFETVEGEEKWKERGKFQRVKLELCPSVSDRKLPGSLLGLLSLCAAPELWVRGEG